MTHTIAPDMADLNGTPVTERHVKWCAEHGHATHTVAGVVQARCPRCGELTATPTPTPDTLVLSDLGGWTGTYSVSYSDEQGNAHTTNDVTRERVLDTLYLTFNGATDVTTQTDRVSGMTAYGRATVTVVPTGWCWTCDDLACDCTVIRSADDWADATDLPETVVRELLDHTVIPETYCPSCDEWHTTDSRWCPDCGATLAAPRSDDDYARELERADRYARDFGGIADWDR